MIKKTDTQKKSYADMSVEEILNQPPRTAFETAAGLEAERILHEVARRNDTDPMEVYQAIADMIDGWWQETK